MCPFPNVPEYDPSKLTPEEQEEFQQLYYLNLKQTYEDSLYEFFKAAWAVLEPTKPLKDSWHYEYLCEYLELAYSGELKKRNPQLQGLIINIPPRTAKSNLVTVIFAVWCWIKNPGMRMFMCSYSQDLSEAHSVKRRDLIQSDWFQGFWGSKFKLRKDRNRLDLFGNDHMGDMLASSVGGSLTGRGGNMGIIDDPLKGEEGAAPTPAKRLEAIRWFDDTFMRRYDDPGTSFSIIVMQRLHQEDLTGYLLGENEMSKEVREEKAKHWLHVCLPLVAEEDKEFVYPKSGKVHLRLKDDVLQPDRFPPEYVEALQKTQRIYTGQYQQRPSPKEGTLYNPNWWMYYDGNGTQEVAYKVLPTLFLQGISVDAAFKDGEDNDYVSITVWGFLKSRFYLLDRINKHLGFSATKQAIRTALMKWPDVSIVCIEDKANGTAVAEELKRELRVAVKLVNPMGGKYSRAEVASHDVEAGNVYLPKNAPWVQDYVDQHTGFPNLAHDDDVDSTSQIIIWRKGRSHGLLEAWNEEMEKSRNPKKDQPSVPEQEPMKFDKLHVPGMAKPLTNAKTNECPSCGNKNLSIYGGGASDAAPRWKCGACGASSDDPKPVLAK